MVAGAVWAAPEAPAQPKRPQRVVSVNLCADQLVMALADREQIAGLTRNATDPQMSADAAKAAQFPILADAAEQLLAIEPDLVVGTPPPGSAALVRRYPVLDLEATESLDQIHAAIRKTAAALGHRARGEAMIARMERDLAAVPRIGEGKVAAYYQRRGFLTGTGTLIDELMTNLGLVNLATRLGKPMLAHVSLEEMVAARPDYLIVESATDQVMDQGTEMLHHPVLRDIPRISIPQAWTVCGSEAYVSAAQGIARQIGRPTTAPAADEQAVR